MICFIRKNIENMICLLVALFLSLVFLISSPLHPWICGRAGTDSSVFKTIAFMMEKGYMPYVDSFDHKGPLLYLLNYLGNAISYYRGIWVIEVCFLTITIFFIYKISRLLCKKISATIVTFISLSLLFQYFEGGNLTEEYAMPFIAIAIYIFADYILNKNISAFSIIISGIGLGVVLMLRPNMIAVWVVFVICIFSRMLILKDFKELGKYIVCFILGLGIIILPIMTWLFCKNDISYFWNDYIVFNKLYSSMEGGRAIFSAKWSAFINFVNTSVYLTAFGSLIFTIRREDKDKDERFFNIIYLVYMIVTILFMVVSGMKYGHYGMIIVPAVAYPLSIVFSDIERLSDEGVKKILLFVITIYSLTSLVLPQWFRLIDLIPQRYDTRNIKEIDNDQGFRHIIDLIQLYTGEDEAISVYGNWDIIYVMSKRKHATQYSYQFPIGQVMPQIMEEYMSQLREELPPVIVVQDTYYDENISDFIEENGYKLLWQPEGENLCPMVFSRR